MSASTGMTRRDFLKLAGGGIVVFVGLGVMPSTGKAEKLLYPEDFNAYLLIGTNGRVTVYSGKIEMGQGVLTSQAQMVAEELGVQLSAIDMVLGDTDKCPWDMGTFGSLTTRMFGPSLRAAAAKAREVIILQAAKKLGVPGENLIVQNGFVIVKDNPNKKVSFGEISKGAKITQVLDQRAVLRAAADFSVIGTSPKRLDALEKVTGAAKYTADIRLPGMLYARILRPPMHGAKLTQVDTADAEKQAGVTVVKQGDLIAVLHADPEAADLARTRIKADWQLPETKLEPDNIFEHLVSQASPLKSVSQQGDLLAAHVGAARLFKSTFYKGYVAHTPLEPHAALAEVSDDKATVWASTQTPFPTRDRVATLLGLDTKNVRVITPFLGGGFGGKSADGQVVEVVHLAKITKKPVQVAWSRSEEFFYDTFDPASVVKIESAVDRDGKISLWDYAVYAAGERGAASLYNVQNARIQSARGVSYGPAVKASLHPFAVGPWRAPGANMNVFAAESQIDIMASSAGEDPLAFRLRNLAEPRMRRVLQAAADAFGWQAAVAPSKRGFGIACSADAGTCVATIAEVKVDPENGIIKVIRIVCAQDMGIVVNPEGAKMQVEGGITMGLWVYLSRRVAFFRGRNS